MKKLSIALIILNIFTVCLMFISSATATTPSTVATSSTSLATLEAFQRKTFFAKGKYWVFYSNGINIEYKTSTDGSTWSSPTYVCPGGHGQSFTLWFDGTHIHYVKGPQGIGDMKYRRGEPHPDGTISWSAPEQIVLSPRNLYIYETYICVDSEGYPWIAYRWGHNGYRYPNCTTSRLNNGTWQTAPGFPYQLSPISTGPWICSIVPLTQRKVYAVYLPGGGVHGRLWNGTAWENEELITTLVIERRFAHSVVAKDDDVHLVFLTIGTNDIVYFKRTYEHGWGSQETVQTSQTSTSYPVLSIDTTSGKLYCFWGTSDTIYSKKRVNEAWDSTPTTWISEPNLIEETVTCFYQVWNARIGVIWTRGNDYYDVRFCSLITEVRQLVVTCATGGTTDPLPETYDYPMGSSAEVTAIPNSGYSFDQWLLDGEKTTENPITVIMDANHTLEAVFVDDIAPEISDPMQEPPENVMSDQNVTVTVNITDLATGVYNATLWYRINNGTAWMPLDMTKIGVNTYQATIPGYKNGTWITYKMTAYDNAGNEARNDKEGRYYLYQVISEFAITLILPIFMMATLLVFIFCKRHGFMHVD